MSNQWGLRRSAAVAAVLAILLVVSLAVPVGAEPAEVTTGWPGPELTLSTSVKPRAVSKTELTPVSLGVEALLGRPPEFPFSPPLSQIKMLLDRHLSISTRSLPTCDPRLQIELGNSVTQRCRPAIVGVGEIDLFFAFPDGKGLPFQAKVPLYNGGTRAGVTHLWGYMQIPVPVPTIFFIPIKLKLIDAGHYGIEAAVSMPEIAEGYGLTERVSLSFNRKYGFNGKPRSVATFRCANGKLVASAEATFLHDTAIATSEAVRTCAVAS